MYQYGPFQSQEAREIRMTGNIASSMEKFEIGLLVCGLAHLHSCSASYRPRSLR